jgi:DNA-binding CsgD family transcriptional regulator
VRNILDKFHLNNRAQVVSYALRSGIVDPDA